MRKEMKELKPKGGDDCYLLQICSDRVESAVAQKAQEPDDWRWPPLYWQVQWPNLNPPKNPRPKTPLVPASPEWTSRPAEELVKTPNSEESSEPAPQNRPTPGTIPVVINPSAAREVVAPVQRKLPIAESFRKPRVIPVAEGGGISRPTAAGKVTVPSHSLPSSTRSKAYAANRVGAKANLALAGLDLGNSIYEAWRDGRIQDAEDAIRFVSKYPDEVARGLRVAGEEGYNALVKMDPIALGEVVKSLTPIPTTVRTTRNLMPSTWRERDTVGFTLDEEKVNELKPKLIGDVSVDETARNLQAGWDSLAKGAENLVRSLSGFPGIPWRW